MKQWVKKTSLLHTSRMVSIPNFFDVKRSFFAKIAQKTTNAKKIRDSILPMGIFQN
jgi:hypothetical protein